MMRSCSIRDKWRSFRERMPFAGKFIIAGLFSIIISGSAVVTYSTYDFTQNNPTFCNKCHIMKESYKAWQNSEHAGINCHECHKLAVSELNNLFTSAMVYGTKKIPVRYDKIIVPWKTCVSCHWEQNSEYPGAVKINASRLHARHYFMEKIECSRCHGYELHEFLPEEKFCVQCHKENKEVHNRERGGLACLNCHTDRTVDLKPERKKCLYCHGDESVRQELINDSTIDVVYFAPSEKIIQKAAKIKTKTHSPMQFHCNECHHPHGKMKPEYGTCIRCHPQQMNVGMHGPHVNDSELMCIDCHQPHSWTITGDEAQAICTDCHEYIEPTAFMGNCS